MDSDYSPIQDIKDSINSLSESQTQQGIDYCLGYTHGLIGGLFCANLITDEENQFYHYEADRVASETQTQIEDKEGKK